MGVYLLGEGVVVLDLDQVEEQEPEQAVYYLQAQGRGYVYYCYYYAVLVAGGGKVGLDVLQGHYYAQTDQNDQECQKIDEHRTFY